MRTENSYGIEKRNKLINIHDKEVYKIAKLNLLYDTVSPTNHTKNLNSHY